MHSRHFISALPRSLHAILFWNVKPGGELASHTLGDYEVQRSAANCAQVCADRFAAVRSDRHAPQRGGRGVLEGAPRYFELAGGSDLSCCWLLQNDDYATHAGEPVLKGEKWVATRWIREDTFV